MGVILRIFRLVLRKYKGRLLASYLSAFGAAIFALAIPWVLGTSVDLVVTSGAKEVSQLYLLALALLLAGAARGVCSFGQAYLAESLSQKVAYDLRNAYFDRLQHLSFGFHDRQMTGALMSRATADVEAVRMFINQGRRPCRVCRSYGPRHRYRHASNRRKAGSRKPRLRPVHGLEVDYHEHGAASDMAEGPRVHWRHGHRTTGEPQWHPRSESLCC